MGIVGERARLACPQAAQLPVERLLRMPWNGRSASRGFRAQHRVETLLSFPWNTQPETEEEVEF